VHGDGSTALPQLDAEGRAEDGVGGAEIPRSGVIDAVDFERARVEEEGVAGEAVEVDLGGAGEYLLIKIDLQIQVDVPDADAVRLGE
jgi:hypothetical protein